jgi:hypothetical protein
LYHLLILAVCRQWFPELFPEEETPLCRPTLLPLHPVDLFPCPAVTRRQWRIPFHLHLVEEWTPHQSILWLLTLLVLFLTLPAPRPLKQILLPRHLADLPPEEETPLYRLTLLHLHPVAQRLCLFPEVSHLYQPILSGLQ